MNQKGNLLKKGNDRTHDGVNNQRRDHYRPTTHLCLKAILLGPSNEALLIVRDVKTTIKSTLNSTQGIIHWSVYTYVHANVLGQGLHISASHFTAARQHRRPGSLHKSTV
eukprot:GHUV01056856.1.p1 GENE.GHUV01056856.1~~GHUV01056856.1.p1  ORF type:complete len:110 (+),score=4.97 GHUV01056856.1:152-481(+)